MTDIELTAADGHRLSAYRSDPAGPAIGGVVVIHEIFGVNAHIRQVTDRFAEAGYVAVAPALFDRVRRGVELAYDAEGTDVGKDIAWNLPSPEVMADATAAAATVALEVGGAANVGAVGFCFGGMVSSALASRVPQRFGATVAYYPSLAAQLLVDDQPHIPLLVHLGDRDARVTPADGEALAARWPTAELHRYPAGHGFNCDLRPDYDEASSTLAWERTLAFLAANLEEGD